MSAVVQPTRTTYETAVIDDLGNGCIRVVSGKLPKAIVDAYDQVKGQPSLWCLKVPKFSYLLNGNILFERPPAKCPKEYIPTKDERVFEPNFPIIDNPNQSSTRCQFLRLEAYEKPSCKCVSVLWRCDKFKDLVVPSRCNQCVLDGNNLPVNNLPVNPMEKPDASSND